MKFFLIYAGLTMSLSAHAQDHHHHGAFGEMEHGLPVVWVLIAIVIFGLYMLFKPKDK